jgi:hypothetical protein
VRNSSKLIVRLHQFKQSKIDGLGTWPEFGKGMHLCVFTDGILVELKNCSNERTKREKNRRDYEDQPFVRLIGTSSVHGDDVQ